MIKIAPTRRLKKLLTLCVCALLLIAIIPRVVTIYELTARKNELLQEKARLTQINQERTQTLADVDTPQGIEKIAREQLGMVKKGERTVIQVIPNQ